MKKYNPKVIIVSIILIGLAFYGGYLMGSKEIALQPLVETEELTQEEFNIKKLFDSKMVQGEFSLNGIIETVLDNKLEVMGIDEAGEKIDSLVIPISAEAIIMSEYVLPENALEEEVMFRVSMPDETEVRIGEKEIGFEQIQVGDNIFVHLKITPEHIFEGIFVKVTPVDLFKTFEPIIEIE